MCIPEFLATYIIQVCMHVVIWTRYTRVVACLELATPAALLSMNFPENGYSKQCAPLIIKKAYG